MKRNLKLYSFSSETAINIGYSCRLLTDEMEEIFIVDGETEQDVKKQMTDFLKAIKDHKEERNHEETVHIQNGGVTFNGSATELNMETPGPDFALVINGHSLVCVPLSLYYVHCFLSYKRNCFHEYLFFTKEDKV